MQPRCGKFAKIPKMHFHLLVIEVVNFNIFEMHLSRFALRSPARPAAALKDSASRSRRPREQERARRVEAPRGITTPLVW